MPGMAATMKEFKAGSLHSGSKHGPVVKNQKQAVAIGLDELRRAGTKIPKPKAKAQLMGIGG
jgi:hypothetical protein